MLQLMEKVFLMSRFNSSPIITTGALSSASLSPSSSNVKNSRLLNTYSEIAKFATWYGVPSVSSNLYVKNGSSSIKVTANSANGTQTALRNNNVSYNFSKIKTLKFLIYVEDVTTIEAIEFYFANATNYADFGSVIVPNVEFMNGWNEVFINLNKLTLNGAFTLNNLIKSIQLRLQCVANKTAIVHVDSLSTCEIKSKANVIFSFDDGWMSEYTTAFPMLLERGFVGNIGLVKNFTGTTNYMSLAQAKEMYDYGWDMFNHTTSHPDLSSLTKNQIKNELTTNRDWLNSQGMTRASEIVAYPYGGYNQNVIDVMKEEKFKLGRSIRESDMEMYGELNPYNLRVRNMIYSFPTTNFTSALDSAIQVGGTVIYLNHRVEATGTDSAIYPTDKFKTVVDYVYSKRDDVNVITFSEWAKQIGKM